MMVVLLVADALLCLSPDPVHVVGTASSLSTLFRVLYRCIQWSLRHVRVHRQQLWPSPPTARVAS